MEGKISMETLAEYSWLLQDADPALVYQINWDLLRADEVKLQGLRSRIAKEGHGRALVDGRKWNTLRALRVQRRYQAELA